MMTAGSRVSDREEKDQVLNIISRSRSISQDGSMADSVFGSNGSDVDDTDFSDWSEDTSSRLSSRNMTHHPHSLDTSLTHPSDGGCTHPCEKSTTLFCEDCEEPMCMDCKTSRHLTHRATTLKNAALERKGTISRVHEELEEETAALSEQLRRYEQYKESLNSNQKSVLESLRKRREHYLRVIDHWYRRKQDQVRAVCSYEMEKLDANIEVISRSLEELRKHTEQLSHYLSYHQTMEVLSLSKDFISHLQVSPDRASDQRPVEQLYFIFNTGSGLTPSHLGDVTARYGENLHSGARLISSGKLVFSFSTREGRHRSYNATGLSVDRYGNMLVSDVGMDMVKVYGPQGKLKMCLDTLPGDEPSKAVHINPHLIAVACRNDIKFYSAHDGAFGHRLKRNLECPSYVCVGDKGVMIVSDKTENGPLIHTYDSSSWELGSSIIGGRRAPVFKHPWYLTSDPATGNIIVSDLSDHTVKVFTHHGLLIREFGGRGAQPGRFFRPAGVCIDTCGHILVADSGNDRVQMFNTNGDLCAVIVSSESDDFMCPMDVAIDDQCRLVVLQGNGVVGTYRYLH